MRKSALFVLVFIVALSAFSIGVGLSYNYQLFAGDDSETVSETRADDKDKDKEKEEEVKDFKVKGVHYKVKADGEVEVDDKGTDTTVIASAEVHALSTPFCEIAFARGVNVPGSV